MTMKFKISAVVAATVLVSTAAHAALDTMPGVGGNNGDSSLAFLALDTAGTPTSLFVDLGFHLTDFDPGSALVGLGQTVVWNFNTNSLTVNGTSVAGTYNWSDQFALFQAAAQPGETKFGVIAGATASYPEYFLTTGNPTAANLTAQTTADTPNMGLVNTLFVANASLGTLGGAGEGANAVVGSTTAASGYVGSNGNFGPGGNWRGSIKWNALANEGIPGGNGLYYMNTDSDDEIKLAGQFSYAAGVLTWQTAPIPEPSGYMIAMAGLAVLGFAVRRRRDDR